MPDGIADERAREAVGRAGVVDAASAVVVPAEAVLRALPVVERPRRTHLELDRFGDGRTRVERGVPLGPVAESAEDGAAAVEGGGPLGPTVLIVVRDPSVSARPVRDHVVLPEVARVGHARRGEDAALHELFEREAGGLLNDPP